MTTAATELAISPSAISHPLKWLETFLQMPLTVRQRRNLANLRDPTLWQTDARLPRG